LNSPPIKHFSYPPRSIGQPSRPISLFFVPVLSVLAVCSSWQRLHSDCNGDEQNAAQLPLCGVM
jgi:hypothetical protein